MAAKRQQPRQLHNTADADAAAGNCELRRKQRPLCTSLHLPLHEVLRFAVNFLHIFLIFSFSFIYSYTILLILLCFFSCILFVFGAHSSFQSSVGVSEQRLKNAVCLACT
ncbi:unnamed protein product [Ceratitis capitata]|uniref:(Mediterranean fruit fly) hypothetical protein n=1 Tax=Ceratitis capitata TaxID=7213 RepID=A0A811U4R3_CERCA|nr:unnamed protein product [Ceratitis capitata]